MNRDAHYYAILAFAVECGFKKESAKTLAYASQFVDDAKINQLTISGPTYGIELDCKKTNSLINMATCHSHSHLKTFHHAAMINNTCAFHFVPGCKGNNFAWKMTCKPEGKILQEIKNAALEDDDLIKFGIVLHAWADSFSHEGFSGLLSQPNDIEKLTSYSKVYLCKGIFLSNFILWVKRKFFGGEFDNVFDRLVPPYGHAQALHYPDEPYIKWSSEYDDKNIYYTGHKAPERNNVDIYKKAFKSITSLLKQFLDKHPVHKDNNSSYPTAPSVDLYDILFTRKSIYEREKLWLKKLSQMEPFKQSIKKNLKYDDTLWLAEAFENYNIENDVFTEKGLLKTHRKVRRVIIGAKLKTSFENSNWYKYYLAVRWYKKLFHKLSYEHGLSFDHEPYYP
jgi:hypothetical protein